VECDQKETEKKKEKGEEGGGTQRQSVALHPAPLLRTDTKPPRFTQVLFS
jgi:hypothetical protein